MHAQVFHWQMKCTKSVVIFGVDNSSSTHTENRKKDLLVFGEGSTDVLDGATITAVINSLHYNTDNGFLNSNNVNIFQCKGKDSEINAYPL